MSKSLTVIVPLYNQEMYIEECIASILNQSFKNVEILIVNDGSTDGSLKICDELAKKDSKIRIISQPNKGLLQARKTGVENCNTDYLTFVDADDFILSEAYRYAEPYMNQDIDLCSFEICRYYDADHKKIEKHMLKDGLYDRDRIVKEIYPKLIWNCDIATPGIECSLCVQVIKTSIMKKIYEKMDMDIYYGEDRAILVPIYKRINSAQVISRCFYMHRQRIGGCASYIDSDQFFEKVYCLYEYLLSLIETKEEEDVFKRQIEYFYMYSVNLKKMKYNDVQYKEHFFFPFQKIPANKRILLYGAGEVGKTYYAQLERIHYCTEIVWVDKNAKLIADDRVISIEEGLVKDFDYVVIAILSHDICDEVTDYLEKKGVKKKKIIF